MEKWMDLLENLLSLGSEYEWFEFKENWFSKDGIGEYISALSNEAALCGKEYGYLIWGIKDGTLDIVGTTINLDRDIDHEPYKHYLARNLKPSIPFESAAFECKGKRVVILEIPAAKSVETKYKGEGFFRIGSSKEKLSHYPEWALRLSNSLSHGIPSITNTQAPEYANSLTFQQLFMYYGARGLELRKETFAQTLKLKTAGGEWNVLAYILSDQNSIPIRVSIFSGTEKCDPLFSVREFGNKCILYSLNQILEYGDTINLAQADERGRVNERKDQPLFDYEAFHEAVLNAFVHNKWVTLNGPSFSVFSNRVEILSVGGLAPEQTRKGFFEGASLPVNEALASLFLQLRLSERSGRGVPKIVHAYGQDSIDIEKNYVKVTIPFLRIGVVKYRINPGKVEDKVKFKSLTKGQNNVLSLMRDNPNITVPQIATKTGLSFPGIYKIIKKFKDEKILQRIGSRKNGYWKVEKEPYVNDKS